MTEMERRKPSARRCLVSLEYCTSFSIVPSSALDGVRRKKVLELGFAGASSNGPNKPPDNVLEGRMRYTESLSRNENIRTAINHRLEQREIRKKQTKRTLGNSKQNKTSLAFYFVTTTLVLKNSR